MHDRWNPEGPGKGSFTLPPHDNMANVSHHFVETCTVLFQSADADGNGYLDPEEFVAVLQSKTLNLKLSSEELEEVGPTCGGGPATGR